MGQWEGPLEGVGVSSGSLAEPARIGSEAPASAATRCTPGDIIRSQLLRHARLVKFFLVGGINTLFGYGVFALMIWLGLHYGLAAAISTIAGVLFNFKTTGRLVFGSHDNKRIFLFVAAYVTTYLLNLALLELLTRAGLNAYHSGLLLIIPMALVSYHLLSRFVFREP